MFWLVVGGIALKTVVDEVGQAISDTRDSVDDFVDDTEGASDE